MSDAVVLVTVDCLRADHVGAYGYERPTTPNVDALAADATVFERTFANSPGTRWAFQTIHTGVFPDQIDGLGVPDVSGVTLAEQFSRAGYATGGFAKNGFLTTDYRYDQGFDRFVGVSDSDRHPLKRAGETLYERVSSERFREWVLSPLHDVFRRTQRVEDGQYRPATVDRDVCDQAVEWIRRREAAGEPYFAWVHLMDAHTPYARWDRHLEALRGDADVEHVIDPHGDVTHGDPASQPVVDAYDAGVRSTDEQVGRVLDEVDDAATVVVTGDHGEEFGRYHDFHMASLHESMTQVPLVVDSPHLDADRIDAPVEHVDVPATLLDAVGVPQPPHFVGEPLRGAVERDPQHPVQFVLNQGEHGVRVGDWKFLRYGPDDDGELYRCGYGEADGPDLADDRPEKRRELADLVDDHQDWMDANVIGEGQGTLDAGDDLSRSVQRNLQDLGYID